MIVHDLFVVQVPLAEKVLRTVVVYAALAVLLRLAGKRDLASLNSFDLLVVVLLSNVVQNAIIGQDDSLLGGLVGAATLVAVNALVSRGVSRSNRAALLFEGSATVLVEDGRYRQSALRRLGIRPADLEVAIRHQNGDGVSEVERASLEPGGSVVVSLKPTEQSATKGDVAVLLARLQGIEARLPG